MIPGVAVTMGGQEWLVPPLTLGQLRHLMPKVRQLAEIGASMGETQIGVLVEIVATALQRNYPDVTEETVENLLDLGNASAVLNAVLTGSGLKPRGTRPGEEEAVATRGLPPDLILGPRTAGDKSTASSPPPAVTAIR